MKLICAGLPKTGTTSIASALRVLGYKVYDIDEQIFYYMDKWLNLFEHDIVPDFYTMFKNVDAVIDVPGSLFFEELMEAFPEAKVVLAVRRDEDAWGKSFKNQVDLRANLYLTKLRFFFPTYKKFELILRYCRMAALGTVDSSSTYIWRKRLRWHNDRVKSVVNEEKLLVYSVDEGWKPLCDFIGKKIPDQPFPHLNVKGSSVYPSSETELGRRITREANVVILCSVVMVALSGVLFIFFLGLF